MRAAWDFSLVGQQTSNGISMGEIEKNAEHDNYKDSFSTKIKVIRRLFHKINLD